MTLVATAYSLELLAYSKITRHWCPPTLGRSERFNRLANVECGDNTTTAQQMSWDGAAPNAQPSVSLIKVNRPLDLELELGCSALAKQPRCARVDEDCSGYHFVFR